MKNLKIYLFALLALVFTLQSCDEEEDILAQLEAENPLPDAVTGTSGTLDFSKYVALGNSLAAGVMDAALYTDGQNHSIPNLFATQLQIEGIGGGAFNQPDINSANGFSGLDGGGAPLGRFELSLSQLRPVATTGELPTAFAGDKSALNNFGVPGMRMTQLSDPGLAVSNPLYGRFASAPGTSTVLGDALAAAPTFFSFWLGNNDILQYATGGGSDESLITSQLDFQNALLQSLGGLTQSGAQGVVLTLPPMVVLPFFRAVPYNSIAMTEQATVDQLNAGFTGLNNVLDGLAGLSLITQDDANARKVSYALGANPILMHDDALTDIGPLMDLLVGAPGGITAQERAALEPYRQSRPATADDLPTLSAATQLGTPFMGSPTAIIGVSYPAPDNLILSASEAQTVIGTRATFNATIAGVVAQINQAAGAEVITLVDVQPAFVDLFGLDAQTASVLIDPSQLTPTRNPILQAMAENAVPSADGVLGIEIDGVNLAPDFSPNGVFSTDGVHPNPRGNAIVANLIISALNSSGKGASIPAINVLALRSVITTN